jgi:flagellin
MSLLRVQNNISALNTQRNLNVNSFNLAKSLQKLSSGFRINTASDGPADLIISEGLRAQIGGLKAAIRNTQEASNFLGIAEGALKEVSDLLVQARALAVHAANTGVVTQDQADADDEEFTRIEATIARINTVTRFAGDAVFGGGGVFQLGEGTDAADTVTYNVAVIGALAGDLTTGGGAIAAITAVDNLIDTIATQRGEIGAFIKNTLQSNLNSLSVTLENVTATESYVRDTNMAEETSNFTKNQILVQAGISVLAQSNVASQSVLALLR